MNFFRIADTRSQPITAATRFRVKVGPRGFMEDEVAVGQIFLHFV